MKHQKLFSLFILTFAALSLAACGGISASAIPPTNTPVPATDAPKPEPPPTTDEESATDSVITGDPEQIPEIFQVMRSLKPCADCHTLDGSLIDKPFAGPSLQGISKIAGDRVPGLSAEEYIRQSIRSPSAYVVEGFPDKMPGSYAIESMLREEEVDELVDFLLTQ